jgi:hypothetical protein
MPYDEVMDKWKHRKLRSGGKGKGHPLVHTQTQAVAIMLSEKRKAEAGNKEYQPKRKGHKFTGRQAGDALAASH